MSRSSTPSSPLPAPRLRRLFPLPCLVLLGIVAFAAGSTARGAAFAFAIVDDADAAVLLQIGLNAAGQLLVVGSRVDDILADPP